MYRNFYTIHFNLLSQNFLIQELIAEYKRKLGYDV